jgi:acetylglutamate kinase
MQNDIQSRPMVLKVGGSFFEDESAQKDFFSALCMLLAQEKQIVVVHRGGNQVQTQLNKLGFESIKHNGLRVTPKEHMPIVCGVLSGTLNKQLVTSAQREDIQAIGFSLADGDFCTCSQISEVLGSVGKPHPQNSFLLQTLLNAHYMPVVSSIGSDLNGELYNVNADQAATCVAQVLDADLFLLSDVPGVLDENKQLVESLSHQQSEQMKKDGVITDGMIVKVDAAQLAADELERPVIVASWASMSKIAISKQQEIGTKILPQFNHLPTASSGIEHTL